MSIVLFEDRHVAQLDPVALGKPAFAIACGSYRLVDLAALLEQPVQAHVRRHLSAIVAADFPALQSGSADPRTPPGSHASAHALRVGGLCSPRAPERKPKASPPMRRAVPCRQALDFRCRCAMLVA